MCIRDRSSAASNNPCPPSGFVTLTPYGSPATVSAGAVAVNIPEFTNATDPAAVELPFTDDIKCTLHPDSKLFPTTVILVPAVPGNDVGLILLTKGCEAPIFFHSLPP